MRREGLYRLIDEATSSHEPVFITGKRSNADSGERGRLEVHPETLYLLSIPGMRESIIEGLKTPVEKCATELDW